MTSLLIGKSGFIGGFLDSIMDFDDYLSREGKLKYRSFDFAVCAAPSASKWLVNKEPEFDLENIRRLVQAVSQVDIAKLILISTVDVYQTGFGCEDSPLVSEKLSYGSNRLFLERLLRERFQNVTTFRLGGLVGQGLKKNPIFDLKFNNRIEFINPDSIMQFLPIEKVYDAIQDNYLSTKETVNLTAPPISLGQISSRFGIKLKSNASAQVQHYDITSCQLQSGSEGYYATFEESITAIDTYMSSEIEN